MLPSIQNLRALILSAESGQLRTAAKRLGLSESAVSHQISRLEAQIGTRLLERGRNGARLTASGEVFVRHVSKGLQEIEAGVRAVSPSLEHVVTITAPRTLSALWLAPCLASFYAEHPKIEVRSIATDRLCDLVGEGIDFALRTGTGPWHGYQQELYCVEEIFPVSDVTISEQVEKLGWEEAIKQVPFILNESHGDEWENWSKSTGMLAPRREAMRSLGSFDIVQAGAINGLGIALARTPLCLEALTDGRLCKVGPEQVHGLNSCQIVWPANRSMSQAQKWFLDWVRCARPKSLSAVDISM